MPTTHSSLNEISRHTRRGGEQREGGGGTEPTHLHDEQLALGVDKGGEGDGATRRVDAHGDGAIV